MITTATPTPAATRTQTTLDLLRAVGSPNPVVDLSAARQFVRAIAGTSAAPMAWVAIAESPAATKARVPSLFLFGPLFEHEAALAEANAAGCSVECVVNQTNGAGIEAADVEAVRALWICTDSEDARFTREQVGAVRPKPHLITEVCRGQFNLFWAMQPGECSLKDFAPALRHITLRLKSSRSVLHIEQRSRVPGFYSWRDESKPFQSEIILDRTRGQA